MNTRTLEYLIAVAEELHFGRAAERCHVSQSALSGQLRKLEDHLGVQVFERTNRHVRLTEIGGQIVSRAKEILRQVNDLETLASATRNPVAGRCALGMPPTIGPYLTPLLLPAVRHYLPDLRLDLVEDFTDNLEQQLAAGALDVAVLATSPTRSILTETVVYDEPFWVALPGDHALTSEETVDVAQIEPGELLLLSDGHCLRDQIYEACKLDRSGAAARSTDTSSDGSARGAEGDTGPRTQKTSLSTILSLVGAGHGVTLVPAMSLSGGWMTDGGIAVRREQSGTAGRTVRLTYRKGFHRMALIEKLADIVAGIVPDTVKAVRR